MPHPVVLKIISSDMPVGKGGCRARSRNVYFDALMEGEIHPKALTFHVDREIELGFGRNRLLTGQCPLLIHSDWYLPLTCLSVIS